jgi:hypothetical protein
MLIKIAAGLRAEVGGMSTHTPGPWKKSKYGELKNPEGQQVMVWGCGIAHSMRTSETEANARLIAAAPDLLEALKEIVQRNEIQHWFNLDQARAAIAKAEGEA